MKKSDREKVTSLTMRVLAGALVAMLVFGSVAGLLAYIVAML